MAKKAIGEKVIISKPDTMYSYFCSTIISATTAKCFLPSIAVNIVTKEHYSICYQYTTSSFSSLQA